MARKLSYSQMAALNVLAGSPEGRLRVGRSLRSGGVPALTAEALVKAGLARVEKQPVNLARAASGQPTIHYHYLVPIAAPPAAPVEEGESHDESE